MSCAPTGRGARDLVPYGLEHPARVVPCSTLRPARIEVTRPLPRWDNRGSADSARC